MNNLFLKTSEMVFVYLSDKKYINKSLTDILLYVKMNDTGNSSIKKTLALIYEL